MALNDYHYSLPEAPSLLADSKTMFLRISLHARMRNLEPGG